MDRGDSRERATHRHPSKSSHPSHLRVNLFGGRPHRAALWASVMPKNDHEGAAGAARPDDVPWVRAMIKPYDATTRELFDVQPAAWVEFFGLPMPDPGLVEIIESNLSTINAEADKLVRVGGPEPYILHVEFLSGRDTGYPEKLHWYNALAKHKHGLPVWSVVILLRRAADGPELTGEYETQVPVLGKNLWFRYQIVRVWELPPERLLRAGLSLLPLAPISDVTPEQLPGVLRAVAQRVRDEADRELSKTLWAATEILLGLNHSEARVEELTREITTMVLGIRGIEESSVYQGIFAKGRAEGQIEEAKKILLAQGRKRFGEPGDEVLGKIAAINGLDRLNHLLVRVLDVAGWDELLTP
jgi:predicted transposase YdaD